MRAAPRIFRPVGAAAALAAGLLIAVLPPLYSGALLAGGVIVGLALWEPAAGLGCALLLGPTRAFLAAAGYAGITYDLGQIFFGLALAAWLARGALRREIILPGLGLYGPLAVWLFLGALSLFGAADWGQGFNELIKWAEVGLVMALALDAARRGRAGWLLAALVLSGVIQAGVGVWQYGLRGHGPASFKLPDGHYRAYGSFEQPNPFGGYLGFIWPVALSLALSLLVSAFRSRFQGKPFAWNLGFGISALPRPRPFSLNSLNLKPFLLPLALFLSAALILLGVYVSFSRGAWLGAAAAGLVLVIFWPRRLAVGLGLAAGALAAGALVIGAGLAPASVTARLANVVDFVNVTDVRGININDGNFALVERLAHWQAAFAMLEARPWLGVGLGNYAAAYPDYRLVNWPLSLSHAHNIYLHLWAETGLLGLAAYGCFWGTAIILTLRTLRRTTGWRRGLAVGLLAVWAHLLAHQLVDNLHVNNNDLLLGAYLGLLYALDLTHRQSVSASPRLRAPAAH